MDIHEIAFSTEINYETAVLRLLVSFIAGMLIGIEREAHSQPAGLRTHILISIGSTMAMLLSIFIPQEYTGFLNGDPGRIAAQVVTGIGFLGAGTILRFGVNVRGLTTAASIWAMAIIGLSIGAGLFKISALATGIILFSLTIMDLMEKFFFQDRIFKKIQVTLRRDTVAVEDIYEIFKGFKIRVSTTDIRKTNEGPTIIYVFYVYLPVKLNTHLLAEKLGNTEGVTEFSEEMIN